MITSSESMAIFGAPAPAYPVEVCDPAPATVLEVGAGSGGGTRHLLDALPAAAITCLEPDDAARNALVWHLSASGSVTDRLIVLPLTLAQVPGRYDLVVGHHVVCQLPVADRRAFWGDVREHLTDTGVALFDTHLGTTEPRRVERKLSAEATFGAATYRRWFSCTPGEAGVDVVVEYEVVGADGTLLHRDEHRSTAELVSEDQGLAMVREAGLGVERRDGWFVLRRA